MPAFYQRRWRVYIEMLGARWYANEDPPTPLPRVRWMLKSKEYPDHFSYKMAMAIHGLYIEQIPKMESVMINMEKDSVG